LTSELASQGREGGALVEALSSPEVTRAFGAETKMGNRHADRLTERLNAQVSTRRQLAGIAQSLVVLEGAGLASVLWIGGREVRADRMTLAVFAAFLVLQSLFSAPLESLLRAVIDLTNVLRLLDRLDDVLAAPREHSGSDKPGRLRGAIRFAGVDFR